MTPKQVEKLAAAAYAVCSPHRNLAHLSESVTALAETLREVDPARVYSPSAPQAGADDSADPSLHDSPRLSRLIGANEAATHD
jgi:hypothetical protein